MNSTGGQLLHIDCELRRSRSSDNGSIVLKYGKLWSAFLQGMGSVDNLHCGCIRKESLNGQKELEE